MKISNARKDAFRVAYKSATKTRLNECYTTWSDAKQRAYVYQYRMCFNLRGYGLKILSANTSFFTVAFLFPDPDTGVVMLHVATGRNTYEFEY